MRVTLSIGLDADDRLDRLSRALSTYQEGGVSRSSVIRGLLAFAEASGLMARDERLLMIERPGRRGDPKANISRLDPVILWEELRMVISMNH